MGEGAWSAAGRRGLDAGKVSVLPASVLPVSGGGVMGESMCVCARVSTQAPLLELFNKYKDSKGKQAKLKSPGQLQELLDIVRALLADMEGKGSR